MVCIHLFGSQFLDFSSLQRWRKTSSPSPRNVSIRGAILKGMCISTKMKRTIIIRRNYLHYIKPLRRRIVELAKSWDDFLGPFLVGTVDGGEKSAVILVDGKDPIIYMFLKFISTGAGFHNHQQYFQFIQGAIFSYCY